jgi:putative tricarboxylic transport membrane protein
MIEYLPYILSTIFQPLHILFIIFGIIIGMIFGAIPGISGAIAMVLFMPMTYKMIPESGLILLLGLYVGGVTGGFIGGILLGIPGAPSSVATTFDGYPMTQKGQAGKALMIGMTASFIGTFFSAIVAAVSSRYIAEFAFKMGPWEYFSLSMMAITMVVAISKGNMFKGLAAAFIGMFLGSIGMSPVDAYSRFTFNTANLLGGMDVTVILLGTFAIAMIVTKYAKGFDAPYKIDSKGIKGFGIPFREIREQFGNILRSFGIGLGIGFLPGMGPALSNLVAYASAKNASKHPERFGKGEPAGVWASEVSNNAAIGGALIPMTALGIPGDTATSLLIGAMTVHGIEMGPMVFRNSGNLVYLVFFTVAIGAFICFVLQRLGVKVFPYVLKIPYHYLYPALLMLAICGGYITSYNIFNCWEVLLFGVVGVIMGLGKLPVSPMILAFVLSSTIESNMLKGFQYGGLHMFFTRPISGAMMVLTVIFMFLPLIKKIWHVVIPNKKEA